MKGSAICGMICCLCILFAGEVRAGSPDQNSIHEKRLVEQSKTEDGLLVYSNMAEYNWRHILAGFRAKYPWIDMETLDMGPSATFERYYSESSVGARTADMIVTAAPEAWLRFLDKGEILPYASSREGELPDWSMPYPGLYTISADPMVLIYNKMLLPEDQWPDRVSDLAGLPAEFRGKITTYDASSHAFALAIQWAAVRNRGPDAWPFFERLGRLTRVESGGSTMTDKVTSGEYVAGYYVSGITVFPKMQQVGRNRILGWSLIKDGTPLFVRGMAVTRKAKSPASAKLLMDYILSRDGQIAVGKGGMTPYRSDVTAREIPYLAYTDIAAAVGEDNVFFVTYDRDFLRDGEGFLDRWRKAYGFR